jgi:hypothetical protein
MKFTGKQKAIFLTVTAFTGMIGLGLLLTPIVGQTVAGAIAFVVAGVGLTLAVKKLG